MRHPADALVPPRPLFGAAVTAEGEGGFNGPGQPENQWWAWEHTGRAASPGAAGDAWAHPDQVLDRALAAGCEVLTLPVQWARVEPSPGRVDGDALDRYARTLVQCAELGIVPMVSLHDLSHPAWLGAEFWLTPGSPDRFADFVARVVAAVGTACRHWVTLLQPNLGALAGWVGGHNPPGRVGAVSDAWAVLDNLCTAHVLAYDAIHAQQGDGVVTMGLVAPGSYDWHRLPVDLMAAPALGIPREQVDSWVDVRRARHDHELPPDTLGELASRRLAALLSPYGRGAGGARWRARRSAASPRRLLDVVYGRPASTPLDGLSVVWSPGSGARSARPDALGQLGRMAGVAPSEAGRPVSPWDAPVDLEGLADWCRVVAAGMPEIPVWIYAGLAMPPGGAARPDGWDRPSYLRAVVAHTVCMADAGTPVAGFCYRDLGGSGDRAGTGADLGLFAVTAGADGDGVVWRDVDGTGAAAGDAFRRVVAAVRSRDRPARVGAAGSGGDHAAGINAQRGSAMDGPSAASAGRRTAE